MRVVVAVGVLGERLGQGEELTEAVPAQVVLLDQLLHVLGRRAAGAGLEQAAAVDQRDDREHLGAGAELEDREEVGEVVAQHVAGDRDRVLALADALERVRRRDARAAGSGSPGRRCRARAGRPGPWRSGWRRGRGSRRARRPRARRSRGRASTASLTQSRTGTSLVWQARQMSPASTSCSISTSPALVDARAPCRRPAISKVLSWRAVLLGGLGHQPDVGDRAHRGRVEGAVGPAVVDDDLVDPGVRRVGDHREGVGLLAVGSPHVAAGADHRRHRRVDDHVGRARAGW